MKYSNLAISKPERSVIMTKCYTYEVTMTVQVLADDEASASQSLDEKGGHVSDRKTKLIKTTDLGNKVKPIKE
jgi:hypothetical protein